MQAHAVELDAHTASNIVWYGLDVHIVWYGLDVHIISAAGQQGSRMPLRPKEHSTPMATALHAVFLLSARGAAPKSFCPKLRVGRWRS